MTPRCIETLAEFSTPENHQRIDEAFFNGHLGVVNVANLWGKSHDFFVAGLVFCLNMSEPFLEVAENGNRNWTGLWFFAVFGEPGSSWTKWAG